MLSVFYISCIYSSALQTRFFMEVGSMNPDQTAREQFDILLRGVDNKSCDVACRKRVNSTSSLFIYIIQGQEYNGSPKLTCIKPNNRIHQCLRVKYY